MGAFQLAVAIVLQHPQVALIGPVEDEAYISFSTKTDSIFGSLWAAK